MVMRPNLTYHRAIFAKGLDWILLESAWRRLVKNKNLQSNQRRID